MKNNDEQYRGYLERIQGIILEHNYNDSGHLNYQKCILKILVNYPFNAEISIIMNVDTWNKYVNYSASRYWRGVLESHPENCGERDFYFNLQDRKFYMASTIEDKSDRVWRESSLENIITVSHSAWRFSRHIYADYNRFHTGQTCEFYAYAIDGNDRPHKPSTVDKDFSKYKWIYDPLTFKANEITSESVEHLITKMQIPKPVADRIIQRKRSRKEARRRWWQNIKTTCSNLYKRFMKQEAPINFVWKGVAIIGGIIFIISSITTPYIRDALVPVLSKISEKRMDDTQIRVIKPENSEDFDSHLRDIFCDWLAKGDIDFNLLSAFDSILGIAGYEDPKQTIQSWVGLGQEQVADALGMPISELDFLEIDLSVKLDQLDVEESFFRFYAHSHNEADQQMRVRHTAGTRLALIALVGEEQQKQIVGAFNERLKSE